jgi:hypothetical protein
MSSTYIAFGDPRGRWRNAIENTPTRTELIRATNELRRLTAERAMDVLFTKLYGAGVAAVDPQGAFFHADAIAADPHLSTLMDQYIVASHMRVQDFSVPYTYMLTTNELTEQLLHVLASGGSINTASLNVFLPKGAGAGIFPADSINMAQDLFAKAGAYSAGNMAWMPLLIGLADDIVAYKASKGKSDESAGKDVKGKDKRKRISIRVELLMLPYGEQLEFGTRKSIQSAFIRPVLFQHRLGIEALGGTVLL